MGKLEAFFNLLIAIFAMCVFAFNGIRAIGQCDIVIIGLFGALVAISAVWARWSWKDLKES